MFGYTVNLPRIHLHKYLIYNYELTSFTVHVEQGLGVFLDFLQTRWSISAYTVVRRKQLLSQSEDLIFSYVTNENTAGVNASVEVSKLHNIKLLANSFYTCTHYNYHDEHFCITMLLHCRQNPKSQRTQRVGDDWSWLLLKRINPKKSRSKIKAASAEPCSSLLTLAATLYQ